MPMDLPAPAFRITVTGARALEEGEKQRISRQVSAVLAETMRLMPGEGSRLRLISPLGEGADRLFARSGLGLKGTGPCRVELEAVLPFPVADYEETFDEGPHSVAEFRELIDHVGGAVLTLDGASDPSLVRQRSYEALGQYLVRNSDLLIAIWDDKRTPNGRGGTADTVRFALKSGVPVWWINAAQDVPPRWLSTVAELEHDTPIPGSETRLAGYVLQLLTPPAPAHHQAEHPLVGALQRLAGVKHDPLATYLTEPVRRDRRLVNIHQILLGTLRRLGRYWMERGRDKPLPEAPRTEPMTGATLPVVERAAELSRKYRDRYRSSYLAILLLGAVALTVAVLALVVHELAMPLLVVEMVALIAIAALWLVNEVFGWHRRYLTYRALAELGRCYQFLGPIGRGSPLAPTANMNHMPAGWQFWLFAAAVRAQPAMTGVLDAARVAQLRDWIATDLIRAQLRFHRVRWAECRGAERLLGTIGVWLFVGTLVIVFVKGGLKIAHLAPGVQTMLGMFAAVLPGLSAATFGIRSYEELGSLADQSEGLIATLEHSETRLAHIVTGAPLAAQEIGAEAVTVTTEMLEETAGWSQLFRSKTIEA